jgi:hypothetical protein
MEEFLSLAFSINIKRVQKTIIEIIFVNLISLVQEINFGALL